MLQYAFILYFGELMYEAYAYRYFLAIYWTLKLFLKCLANPKEGKNREDKEKSNSKMIDSKPVIAIITLNVQ